MQLAGSFHYAVQHARRPAGRSVVYTSDYSPETEVQGFIRLETWQYLSSKDIITLADVIERWDELKKTPCGGELFTEFRKIGIELSPP